MTAALFLIFFVLMFLGVPIAVCLGLSAIIIIATTIQVPLIISASTMFSGIDSFPLMAIPFFILAGDTMNEGGLSKRLINVANLFMGRMKGGLAIVAIFAAMLFSAISGSCPATTAAIGSFMVPEMKRAGYDRYFAGATVAAAGTIGMIIPPGIGPVVYSVLAGTSVAKMFLAGVGPGILMGIVMIVYAYIYGKKHNLRSDAPRPTIKESLMVLLDSFWAILMPVIILGGIYAGVFTATEAAAVSVFYGLFVGLFIYKDIKIKDLPKILSAAGSSTAVIMLLMGAAGTFGWLLTRERMPQAIATAMLSLTTDKILLLVLFNIVFLIAGCFLSSSSAIVLLTPILLPVLTAVGIDPYMIGTIMIVNLSIGQITPPVGTCLYVACNLDNLNFEKLIRSTLPYLWALLISLVIITYYEPITMAPVRWIYGA